jgi:hypothetical protein
MIKILVRLIVVLLLVVAAISLYKHNFRLAVIFNTIGIIIAFYNLRAIRKRAHREELINSFLNDNK